MACYRYLNFSVVNPVGTFGEVNSLNVYVRNTSASQYVNMGLYKDGYIVYQGSAVKVNDSDGEWVEFVPDNLGIQDGNYCLAVYYNTGLEFAYQSLAGYSANKSAASSSVFPYLQVIDGNYTDGAVVMFMDYSVLSGEVSYVDTSATSGMWLGVGVSFGLVAVSLLLALKSRSWAVNFLFGLSLVGFLGWEFANATTELFGGWLLFMVLVYSTVSREG